MKCSVHGEPWGLCSVWGPWHLSFPVLLPALLPGLLSFPFVSIWENFVSFTFTSCETLPQTYHLTTRLVRIQSGSRWAEIRLGGGGEFLSGGSWGDTLSPCLFQLLEATLTPWLSAPSSTCKASQGVSVSRLP